MKEKIFQLALFIAIFFAFIIIISNLIGFFWLNSALILILSIVISVFVFKKFPLKNEAETGTILLSLLLIFLLAYPVLLITPFHPASSDVVSTTIIRILREKIPLDSEPYAAINLSYPLGLPLIVSAFSKTIGIFPDYLWTWIIGLVAGAMQLLFFSLFASELFKDKKITFLAGTVFLAGKLVFENFYVGEFAWHIGTAFLFCFMYAYLKKSPLQYLFFPIVFVCHPVAGFNLLVIFGTYHLFYGIEIKRMAKLFCSLIAVLPLITMVYFPMLYNLITRKTALSELAFSISLKNILAVPFWIGTGLSVMLVLLLIISFLRKKSVWATKEQKFLWALLFISAGLFLGFSYIGFVLAGKEIEVTLIAVALLVISLIQTNQLMKKKAFAVISVIILMALFFFFSSSILEHYREGSKINSNEIIFAEKIYSYDKELKKVLFLTNRWGKIAEYSNKIPFDVNSQHTLAVADEKQNFLFYQDEGFKEMRKKQEIQKNIFYDGNVEKIKELDIDYIAVDRNEFKKTIEYEKVLEYNNFELYKK
jgi:hypothetical protein